MTNNYMEVIYQKNTTWSHGGYECVAKPTEMWKLPVRLKGHHLMTDVAHKMDLHGHRLELSRAMALIR